MKDRNYYKRKASEKSKTWQPPEEQFEGRARVINEKRNFLKNVISKSKDFIKNYSKEIKKNAKKVWKDIQIYSGRRKTPQTFMPGKLVAFNYNAKHKEKAYDKNPLVIMLGPSRKKKNLFLGLNIHWLPMSQRVALASFFLELRKKRNDKLTYDDIKPFLKKFEGHPVLRSYYYSRVSKKVYEMIDDQYLSAAAVPSEHIVRNM